MSGLLSLISPALPFATKVAMGLADARDYNGFGSLNGTTTDATGPGTIGSRDSYGSNQSPEGSLSSGMQAAMAASLNGVGYGGGMGGLGGYGFGTGFGATGVGGMGTGAGGYGNGGTGD